MRYYKVMVQLGHMGYGSSRETNLYIYANGILDAIKIARRTPAVKHKKLPINVVEITKEEFEEGRKKDPYIKAMDELNHGVR